MKDGLDPVEVGRKIAEIAMERNEARALVAQCYAFLEDLKIYQDVLGPRFNGYRLSLMAALSEFPWLMEASN